MTVTAAETGHRPPHPDRHRRGRHRNKALAAWRRARAVELAIDGRTYQQIADELGYANRGTVYRIVARALADREAEAVDTLRDLEVARLNALQNGLWDRAMAGDIAAGSSILKIIQVRCAVLGLLGRQPGGKALPRTVVVDPRMGD